MKKYELFLLVRPDISEAALNQVLKDFESVLAKNKAKITEQSIKGKQKVSYNMKGFNDAYHVLLFLDADPGSIKAINRQIELDENFLKHLLQVVEIEKEKVS